MSFILTIFENFTNKLFLVMNGIEAMITKDLTPEKINTQTHHHLCEVLVTRNRRTPFNGKKLKDLLCKNWRDFIEHMSPSQIEAFEQYEIQHGLVTINGYLASGKSHSAVMVSVCCINNNAESTYKQCALVISETNAAVDSLAEEFHQYLPNPKQQDQTREYIVIRLLPLEAEIQLMQSHMLPKVEKVNIFKDDDLLSKFIGEVENNLHRLGQDAEDARRRGDKRRTEKIRVLNLTLEQAMLRRLEKGIKDNDAEYVELRDNLLCAADMQPMEPGIAKDIKEGSKRLLVATIREAEVICCTIATALRPKVIKLLNNQVTHVLLDEGGKAGSGPFAAVFGVYENIDFGTVDGDNVQQTPYARTHKNDEFPNAFSHVLKESALAIALRLTNSDVCLREQHRMWTHDFVCFLSVHFYAGRLKDGNLRSEKPAEYKFCKQFLNDDLGFPTQDNFVMITIDSRDTKQKTGTSRVNKHHLLAAFDMIKRLLAAIDASEDGFDKTKFTIEYTSPYKAQVQEMGDLLQTLKDDRVHANTVQSIQGIGRHVVIYDSTGSNRLTDFADEERNSVVALSRHKYALIVLANKASTQPITYDDKAKHWSRLSGKGRNICALADYAQKSHSLKEIPAPETVECRKCHQMGHTAKECTIDEGEVPVCRNCCGPHEYNECPDPITRVEFEGMCHKCHLYGHSKPNCKTPFCKKCRVFGHEKDTCPHKQCTKCHSKEHWMGPTCPLFVTRYCARCGSDNHMEANCKEKVTKALLSQQKVLAEPKPSKPLDELLDGIDLQEDIATTSVKAKEKKSLVAYIKLSDLHLTAPTSEEQEQMQLDHAIKASMADNNTNASNVNLMELRDPLIEVVPLRSHENSRVKWISQVNYKYLSYKTIGNPDSNKSFSTVWCMPAQLEHVNPEPFNKSNVMVGYIDGEGVAYQAWIWKNALGQEVHSFLRDVIDSEQGVYNGYNVVYNDMKAVFPIGDAAQDEMIIVNYLVEDDSTDQESGDEENGNGEDGGDENVEGENVGDDENSNEGNGSGSWGADAVAGTDESSGNGVDAWGSDAAVATTSTDEWGAPTGNSDWN